MNGGTQTLFQDFVKFLNTKNLGHLVESKKWPLQVEFGSVDVHVRSKYIELLDWIIFVKIKKVFKNHRDQRKYLVGI